MESKVDRRGSGEWVKGFRKVAQYEDIIKQELANSKRHLYLPERYVFQATQKADKVARYDAFFAR